MLIQPDAIYFSYCCRLDNFTFEFRPNPIVFDVAPKRSFVTLVKAISPSMIQANDIKFSLTRGGVQLTAIGQSFDSVFRPIFIVDAEIRSLVSDNFAVQYNASWQTVRN